MADITLHKDNGSPTTSIPNRFIDKYMINANGEYVKIYLYLLRCMNSPDCSFSISKTADKFDHTEKDIQRALRYWEKMSLLRLEYAEDTSISGIYLLEPLEPSETGNDDAVPLKKADAPLGSTQASAAKPVYSANDIQSFRQKEEVQEMLFVAERYLGRPLTPTDTQSMLYWYDTLGLSADLIVYLMEYCIAGGHSSLHYMERVALAWKSSGIRTVAEAKHNASSHNKLHFAVMKSMGIQGRSLVPAESAYIEKWNKDLGFGQEMITEACSRTILAIHQPNFEYTDRILANWKKHGVQTPAAVKKADKDFQAAKNASKPSRAAVIKTAAANRFTSFPQRTYNIDQLEAELLNSTR